MRRRNIYGEVNSAADIRRINNQIRDEIRTFRTRKRITELVKRSAYLCTLTFSPGFAKKLRGKLLQVRKVAKEEYTRTARLANRRVKQLKLRGKLYDESWG